MLVGLLQQEQCGPGTWAAAALDDLVALRETLPQLLAELPPLPEGVSEWERLWMTWPMQWKQLVARAEKVWRTKPAVPRPGPPPPQQLVVDFICSECGYIGATKQALVAHSFQHHGRISELRKLVSGTRCAACSWEFWTRELLRQHVRRGGRGASFCLLKYTEGCFAGPSPGEDADDVVFMRAERAAGRKPTLAILPAMPGHQADALQSSVLGCLDRRPVA